MDEVGPPTLHTLIAMQKYTVARKYVRLVTS